MYLDLFIINGQLDENKDLCVYNVQRKLCIYNVQHELSACLPPVAY